MKKICFVIILVIFSIILLSCASQRNSGSESSNTGSNTGSNTSSNPESNPASNSPGTVNLRATQERYGSGINLEGAQRHTVVRGDTLARIARARYGYSYYYPLIFVASRNTIQNPDRIYTGSVLVIPNLERNLSNAEARANLKNILIELAVFEEQRGNIRTATDMRNLANDL